MGGLTLLARARAAELAVFRQGEKLVVQGSETAGEIARELLTAKAEILAALSVEAALGLNRPWREESIAACRQRLLDAGGLIREFARSRWTAEADRWPVEMLAGFYVRGVLAGMEVVLGPCDGWKTIRARLDHQTGPTAIVLVWEAYAALPDELRSGVEREAHRA